MLFNSIEFAVFLIVVFLLYWLAFNQRVRVRNLFIIAVSYLFYGWWDWRFLLLIAFTSLCSYLTGIAIGRAWQEDRRPRARFFCGLNILINLGILCMFKYYNFFVTQFAAQFLDGDTSGMLVKLILPVGISFYTFQALSYSIDVYRRKLEPTRDITAFFAYIAFFPQLVAGPIERATNLLPQFYKLHRFDYNAAVDGARRILWGLFKKVLVADNCAAVANSVFENYHNLPASSLWIGAIAFSFQIYGDFSGYSDIAIGTARLFGYNLMQNFRIPYFSRNIGEFWKRWHISLNTWFVDYLYIPLGGSRVSPLRRALNVMITFTVSGLWHGASLNYVAWGMLNGAMQVAEGFLPKPKEGGRLRRLARMLVTFLLIDLTFLFFRASSLGAALRMLRRVAFSFCGAGIATGFSVWQAGVLVVSLGVLLLIDALHERGRALSGALSSVPGWMRGALALLAVLLIVVFGIWGPGYAAQAFIYFQF